MSKEKKPTFIKDRNHLLSCAKLHSLPENEKDIIMKKIDDELMIWAKKKYNEMKNEGKYDDNQIAYFFKYSRLKFIDQLYGIERSDEEIDKELGYSNLLW